MTWPERELLAQKIAQQIEAVVPAVRHGVRHVSGVQFFNKLLRTDDDSPDEPQKFRVVFGAVENCREAAEALAKINIGSQIREPGEGATLWVLDWTLPIDWKPPTNDPTDLERVEAMAGTAYGLNDVDRRALMNLVAECHFNKSELDRVTAGLQKLVERAETRERLARTDYDRGFEAIADICAQMRSRPRPERNPPDLFSTHRSQDPRGTALLDEVQLLRSENARLKRQVQQAASNMQRRPRQ